MSLSRDPDVGSLDPAAKVDVVMWHKAHLEYGCGTSLANLSSVHWNQDEDYGGFNGRHAIVKGCAAADRAKLHRLMVCLPLQVDWRPFLKD